MIGLVELCSKKSTQIIEIGTLLLLRFWKNSNLIFDSLSWDQTVFYFVQKLVLENYSEC